MLAIIPKRLNFESELCAKDFLEKLNNNIYIPKETGLFKVSRIIKNHYYEDMFYGSRRENAFTVFHHNPKKRDGGGVRFNGVVIDTEKGCKVAGYLRHGLFTYVFAVLWVVLLFMITVVLIVEDPPLAVATIVLMVVGFLLMFWDKSSKRLKLFMENLCENEIAEDNEITEDNENNDKKE